MFHKLSRRHLRFFLYALSVAFLGVVAVSLFTVYQLTFAGDFVAYGTQQSKVANEIRTELLKRADIKLVSFNNNDGQKLAGFIISRPQPKANIILCHGYKSSKEFMYGLIDLFPDWNVLAFDFRAHGQSNGNIISIGCNEYKDVIAAADYFRPYGADATGKNLPLILLGISMGGAASLKATEIRPDLCDGLIIDSTFANLNTTMMNSFTSKSGLPSLPFYPMVKSIFEYMAACNVHEMNPAECVKYIKQPILFIHSCDDKVTSPTNSVSLFANTINPYSKLWIGPRCRHGWLHTYHTREYKARILKFFKRALPGSV